MGVTSLHREGLVGPPQAPMGWFVACEVYFQLMLLMRMRLALLLSLVLHSTLQVWVRVGYSL